MPETNRDMEGIFMYRSIFNPWANASEAWSGNGTGIHDVFNIMSSWADYNTGIAESFKTMFQPAKLSGYQEAYARSINAGDAGLQNLESLIHEVFSLCEEVISEKDGNPDKIVACFKKACEEMTNTAEMMFKETPLEGNIDTAVKKLLEKISNDDSITVSTMKAICEFNCSMAKMAISTMKETRRNLFQNTQMCENLGQMMALGAYIMKSASAMYHHPNRSFAGPPVTDQGSTEVKAAKRLRENDKQQNAA